MLGRFKLDFTNSIYITDLSVYLDHLYWYGLKSLGHVSMKIKEFSLFYLNPILTLLDNFELHTLY